MPCRKAAPLLKSAGGDGSSGVGSMIQVKRLGHATFNTPDLARIVDYWTRIMGLTVVEQGPKRAFLATKYGEESVVVEAGDNANLTRAAFQVAPGTDIGELQKDLSKN